MGTDSALKERGQAGAVNSLLMAGLVSSGLLLVVQPAPFSIGPVMAGVAGLAAIFAAAFLPRPVSDRQRLAMALIGSMLILEGVGQSLYIWPLHLLLPLTVAVAVSIAVGRTENLRSIWRCRPVSAGEWVWIGLVAVIAAAAINMWLVIAKPDLDAMRAMVPPWRGPALVAAGLLFAVVNAVLEEAVWRGILMQWLCPWTGPAGAVLIQAVSFGFAHWNGIPSGWSGVLLAGGYGLILGRLVLRSGTLLPAILAHVAADIAIFAMLVLQ